MLENSRLPLKKVLNALDISYKEYFQYFSVLFPVVLNNQISFRDNITNVSIYEVDFSYLDFNKTEYTLRFGPHFELSPYDDFKLSPYDDNVYFLLKEDVKYNYVNFISEYPQDTNIVSNISMWKNIIERDNLENRNLLKLLKEVIFTLQPYGDTYLYQTNHFQYNENFFLKSSRDYYKFDVNKLKTEYYNSVENIRYQLLDIYIDNLVAIHKQCQSVKDRPSKSTEQNTKPKPTEQNTMSKSDTISNVVDTNKVALITATKLEVGNLALDLVTEQFLKTMPEPLRAMIAKNPASKILVANLVNLLVSNTNVQDQRLLMVNESMMTAGYMEFFKTFDIQNILNNVVNQIPSNKLDTLKEDK